jgi:hypothetical protein
MQVKQTEIQNYSIRYGIRFTAMILDADFGRRKNYGSGGKKEHRMIKLASSSRCGILYLIFGFFSIKIETELFI